jgi:flagellar biosynthesis chaperone FliJ
MSATITAIAGVTTIIVNAGRIRQEATNVINQIGNILAQRNRVNQVYAEDLQNVWQSSQNTDSDMFRTRMQELENDIIHIEGILDQYVQVLNQSAQQYENTQNQIRSNAQGLTSPRNR